MAKPKKLKVFRTPIGFHDAYIAAPSQKAALEAWGSGTNLFTQGAAEVVTDAELTKEPLARPGEVIRTPRGSHAEQIKALGTTRKKVAGFRLKSGTTEKRGRKPSRAAVEKAERAVDRAKARQRDAVAKLRAEERTLEDARERYRAAMEKWAK